MSRQTIQRAEDTTAEPSLARLLEGDGLTFMVGEQTFLIRQPLPAEYDEAMEDQRIAKVRTLADPRLKGLDKAPVTPERQAMYQELIDAARATLATAGGLEKKVLQERIANYERQRDRDHAANELSDIQAALVRDRKLTFFLLCDEEGRSLMVDPARLAKTPHARPDPNDPGDVQRFQEIPVSLLEGARTTIWRMLRLVENLPFDSARRFAPSSDSPSAGGSGPMPPARTS